MPYAMGHLYPVFQQRREYPGAETGCLDRARRVDDVGGAAHAGDASAEHRMARFLERLQAQVLGQAWCLPVDEQARCLGGNVAGGGAGAAGRKDPVEGGIALQSGHDGRLFVRHYCPFHLEARPQLAEDGLHFRPGQVFVLAAAGAVRYGNDSYSHGLSILPLLPWRRCPCAA